MRVLVIDNYDSFVYNLVQYLAQLGADSTVLRNDAVQLDEPAGMDAVLADVDGVLISPGPGTPQRAGVWGAVIERAPELLHGKTSQVHHDGSGVLAGLPSPFTATRYHSLTILPESMPAELEVTGRTDSGVIMSIRHRELPIHGVQFHPESVLTHGGHRLLATWMARCGHPVAEATVVELSAEVAGLAAS